MCRRARTGERFGLPPLRKRIIPRFGVHTGINHNPNSMRYSQNQGGGQQGGGKEDEKKKDGGQQGGGQQGGGQQGGNR